MRPNLSLPSSLVFSCLLLAGALLPLQASAQTVQTSDYIYIGFEAEDHVSKDERWVTTTPSTPTEDNDPDGNHSDQAGGSTYLEVLPDMRVTHDDEFGPPTAFWGSGGQGPAIEYLVDFPEPGRYYVHARAYSTGTEDNGMHVGINGTWPASGQRMQFCIAQHRAWWWGSAQRDAGGNGSCGTEKTIWLDVPSAGVHTVNVSAREDGFELDRIALIKDLSGNTRICSPTTLTGVNCRNGSIESADGFVDLRVILSAEPVGADPEAELPDPVEVELNGDITLTAIIENLDAFDTANDIVLTLSPVDGEWQMMNMDQRCTAVGDEFECTLNSLHPTAPNENAPFVFTMKALIEGENRIDASLISADLDDTPANDVAQTTLKVGTGVAPAPKQTDVKLSMDTDKNQYETGETVMLSVGLNNIGEEVVDEVTFNLPVPTGLMLANALSLPSECSFTNQVQCTFLSLAVASSKTFTLDMVIGAKGVYTLSASIASENDVNSANNLDSDSFSVTDPVVDTTTSGSADSASATAGSSDGMGTVTAGDSGSVDGATAGDSAGSSDDGADSGTTQTPTADTKSGALAHWFLFVVMLFCLTRLYGWHQRQLVAIKK